MADRRSLRVAIVGGGHGAFASAADLAERGHLVRMWRRDPEQVSLLAQRGAIELVDFAGRRDVQLDLVSTDLASVVEDAELVMIPLPSTTQDDVATALVPLLRDGQVVFLPPGNMGTYVFASRLQAAGSATDVVFAEGSTLPYIARKSGPTSVTIVTRATRLSTGFFPDSGRARALEVLQTAYPCVDPVTDILDAALINLGFVLHVPLVLLNAGAIEANLDWNVLFQGGTPSVLAVQAALDAERIAVREALGYPPPHFRVAPRGDGSGVELMYGNIASERPGASPPPERIDLRRHRFVTEDLVDGVVLLVSLAALVQVPVPVAEALCTLGSLMLDVDLAAEGRTLERLGLGGFDQEGLQRHLREGFSAPAGD